MEQIINIETIFLINLLNDSLDIGCNVFNKNRDIIYSTSSDPLSSRILSRNDDFLNILENKENEMPVLFGSSLGTMWISCFDQNENIFVLGPFLSSELSESTANETLKQYDISLNLKYKIMDFLQTLPVVSYNSVFPYAILLHYTLNREKIASSDIQTFSNEITDDKNVMVSKKDRSRTWKAEQQLMKNIEEGNLNYKQSLSNARALSYGMRISTGNPSRQIKNSLLTFISLSARAAIRGGMTPEMAYTISDSYAEKIEQVDQMSELARIADQMFEEYIRKVHDLKTDKSCSDEIQAIRDHIDLHIEEDISLASLSAISGYSDYYLSRRFKKETGIPINRYIAEKKIAQAKSYLQGDELSIKEIAEKLHFASETYFSTVFKKLTGESPAAYRKKR